MNTQKSTTEIEFWHPQMGRVESQLIGQVLGSNFLNDGEVTARFEQKLAELLGVKHVITTTSGTTALFAALVAAGIGPGNEVLVPDVTFIATANAVTLAGATAVLVDVEPDSLTICPQSAAKAITKRTRAIIPVHISGRAADMNAIEKLAKKHQLKIIEDAAEALGSRWSDGRFLGTLGDAGCLSFSPNKIITTGQGGAVATNDDSLAHRLRMFKDQGRAARGTGGDDVHAAVGFNLKFTNLQAAVGLGQIELLSARQKRMREIYQLYREGLRDVENVRILGFDEHESPLWIDVLAEDRDRLDEHLRRSRIHGRRFWHPLHTQAPYRKPAKGFPHATAAGSRAFWLPSSFLLRSDQIERVCDAIKSFYCGDSRLPRAEAA